MMPVPYRIVARRQDTSETATLILQPVGPALPAWRPGQFTMVYAFGVGEIPISISGGAAAQIQQTVRAVGAVSRAICAAPVGTMLGLRGPFGHGWPPPPAGDDVMIVAGGIGLAPLRPVIAAALAHTDRGRREAGRVAVLVGARTPGDLLFTPEYDRWRAAGARVLVTVDRAGAGWPGHVGVVTTLLGQVAMDDARATAYVCGPEIMMRLSARALIERGVPAERIWVSLERNMQCGLALCGHCQLGPVLVCRDGPVAAFDRAEALMLTRQL